jgi:hypothetical protein
MFGSGKFKKLDKFKIITKELFLTSSLNMVYTKLIDPLYSAMLSGVTANPVHHTHSICKQVILWVALPVSAAVFRQLNVLPAPTTGLLLLCH